MLKFLAEMFPQERTKKHECATNELSQDAKKMGGEIPLVAPIEGQHRFFFRLLCYTQESRDGERNTLNGI